MDYNKTQLICAGIAAVGAILSAVISWLVSRLTASKEIDKLKLTWEREDVLSSEDEFATMASAVTKYIQCSNGLLQRESMAAVAAIRAKETGEMGTLLDQLYTQVQKSGSAEIDKTLTLVIQKRRETKAKTGKKQR